MWIQQIPFAIHSGRAFRPFMGMLFAQGIEFHAQKQHFGFGAKIVVRLCVFRLRERQFLLDI